MKLPPAKILEGIEPDEYHKLPGLSSSYADTIITRSARHAWAEHPCLGGKDRPAEDKSSKPMNFGSAVHTMVLGRGKRIAIIEGHKDYKKAAAQEARDAALAAGRVPLLTHQFEQVATAAAAITTQLAERGFHLDGHSELAIEWHEPSAHGPVQCRGMLDHAWLKSGVILDLKSTTNAAADALERTAENLGYAIQQAAYRRAMTALLPELAGRIDFLFAFCELEFPYAVNIVRPNGMFRALGEERWLRAVEIWGECIAKGTAQEHWPAYGGDINSLGVPEWVFKREMYRADAA